MRAGDASPPKGSDPAEVGADSFAFRIAAIAVLALALALAAAGPAPADPAGQDGGAFTAAHKPRPTVDRYPWRARLRSAAHFARGRTGAVSFAVVDERGHIHGFHRGAPYRSASLVKAMLLVAYLSRHRVRDRRLHGSERRVLGPMIRRSDNGAASRIHATVGSRGLRRVARRAGMTRFTPNRVWGGSLITAGDQARFFFRIRGLVPERHRSYALGLLRRIVSGQRWGLPHARPRGWAIHFKGGWYPAGGGWRVHQGALLRKGGRRLSIAVLTEGGPSLGYGASTLAGVERRVLRGYTRYRPPAKRRPKRPKAAKSE